MHECEDVIGEARGVGVMFFDSQVGLMVKQAVEDIRGVAYPDVDDLGAERRVLIRDVGIEELAGLGSVFGIDMTGALALPPVLNRCPSEDDVVPSPQFSAKGWRTEH